MPNYVPKEKKPVLTREVIKKDIMNEFRTPPFYRFLVFLIVALSVPVSISGISYAISLFFVENGFLSGIYYLVGSLIYAAIACLLSWLLSDMIFRPILVRFDKFNVAPDTIHHKVSREQVRDWGNRREHNGSRYRYPNVLYFNKYGRYELCYDAEGRYGENEGRRENRLARKLDSYKLEKEYIVVSVGKRKPKIALIYDPDEYDVQL